MAVGPGPSTALPKPPLNRRADTGWAGSGAHPPRLSSSPKPEGPPRRAPWEPEQWIEDDVVREAAEGAVAGVGRPREGPAVEAARTRAGRVRRPATQAADVAACRPRRAQGHRRLTPGRPGRRAAGERPPGVPARALPGSPAVLVPLAREAPDSPRCASCSASPSTASSGGSRGHRARGLPDAHRLHRPAPGPRRLLPGLRRYDRVDELWDELREASPSAAGGRRAASSPPAPGRPGRSRRAPSPSSSARADVPPGGAGAPPAPVVRPRRPLRASRRRAPGPARCSGRSATPTRLRRRRAAPRQPPLTLAARRARIVGSGGTRAVAELCDTPCVRWGLLPPKLIRRTQEERR